jgi:hypothetical protein
MNSPVYIYYRRSTTLKLCLTVLCIFDVTFLAHIRHNRNVSFEKRFTAYFIYKLIVLARLVEEG